MFIVEGNIGAGKSTFLTMLKAACPAFTIVQEPVHNWASKRYGQSLLEEFYKEPSRWAFTLETFAMLARSLDHIKNHLNNNALVIMERSIYSGHYCFAKNGFKEGYFSDIEWEVYNRWVNFIIHQQCQSPRGFIYLQTSPERCHTHMAKRNREGEELVSLTYLQSIHDCHETLFIDKTVFEHDLNTVPVLVLNVNQDFQNDPTFFADLVEKTNLFIHSL